MKKISHILSFLLLFLYSSCYNDDNNYIGPSESQLIELGKLNFPYKNSFDYAFRENEPNDKITYSFSMDAQRSYIIKSDQDVQLILKDSQGNILVSRNNFITTNPLSSEINSREQQLTTETMRLELINKDSTTLTGRLSISIGDVSDTEMDIDTPSYTLDESFNFSIKEYEPDNRPEISFDIISTTSFNISANANVLIGLYNEQEEVFEDSLNSSEITGEHYQ